MAPSKLTIIDQGERGIHPINQGSWRQASVEDYFFFRYFILGFSIPTYVNGKPQNPSGRVTNAERWWKALICCKV